MVNNPATKVISSCTEADFPSANQKPEHQDHFPDKGKHSHTGMIIRRYNFSDTIGHISKPGDNQEHTQVPGCIAGTVNEITERQQVYTKNYQAHLPSHGKILN
jgi:hypothetical protein